jgi:nitrate/nitrite-specific signal transduction histidine kinase
MQRQHAAGHLGLPVMRERAAVIRGRLDVRSEIGAVTQIELRIPAAIAYGAAAHAAWWQRLVGM